MLFLGTRDAGQDPTVLSRYTVTVVPAVALTQLELRIQAVSHQAAKTRPLKPRQALSYCRGTSTMASEPDPATDRASSPDIILKHSYWLLNGGTARSFSTSGVTTHTQCFWKHHGCAHQNSTYKLNF